MAKNNPADKPEAAANSADKAADKNPANKAPAKNANQKGNGGTAFASANSPQGSASGSQSTSSSDTRSMIAAPQLSSLQQASMLLLSMGEEGAAQVMQCFSRDEILAVTRQMSSLSGIKTDVLANTMRSFFDEYREQSGVHGASRSFLKKALDQALGHDIANRVLDRVYGDKIHPKMARLQWASPRWLAGRILREHEQMQAVFLAFLPSDFAGKVLSYFPADMQDKVLFHTAKLKEIDSDLVQELDALVDIYLASLNTQNLEVRGTTQTAKILNHLPKRRQEVLNQLKGHDEVLADEIESKMYDFFILSAQTDAVLTRILDEVNLELWAVALKGALPAIRQALIRVMPRRQIQGLEVMMRQVGPVPYSRAVEARVEIMSIVKSLAATGEIDLQLFPEEVVD